jgi:hypothetical protein
MRFSNGTSYTVRDLELGPVRPSPHDASIMIQSVMLPVNAIESNLKCGVRQQSRKWGKWKHLSDDERNKLMYGPIQGLSVSERDDRRRLLLIAHRHRLQQRQDTPWPSDIQEQHIVPITGAEFDLAFGPYRATWSSAQKDRRLYLRSQASRRLRKFKKPIPMHIIVDNPETRDKRPIEDPDMPPAKKQRLSEDATASASDE